MTVSFKLCFLISLSAATADVLPYTPLLTLSPIVGKVTASTFVLDKPQCIFGSSSSNEVWIVVANSTANIDIALLATKSPYSSFRSKQYYHTFKNPESFYHCANVAEYIRIGADAVCTGDFCNYPLPQGSYKVAFVVFDSNGALISQTSWSRPITLRKAKDASTIDTWPGGRSGGMIVITSILSVLLAAFLAALVGTFIVASKNLPCGRIKSNEQPIPQQVDIKKYNFHNAPASLDIYAQPVA